MFYKKYKVIYVEPRNIKSLCKKLILCTGITLSVLWFYSHFEIISSKLPKTFLF